MSGLLFLRSESDLRSGILKFPDLKSRLEQSLNLSQTLPDLEQLIGSVNDLMRQKHYSLEEKDCLKRIRQRAYDRKRKASDAQAPGNSLKQPNIFESSLPVVKIQDLESKPIPIIAQPNEEISMLTESRPLNVQNSPVPSPQMSGFRAGFLSAMNKIDGERFARALPGATIILGATALVGWFIWQQSVSIYQSIGFDHPELIAAGALMMVVGFAAYHSISRSTLALLLCIYAGCYETYLMTSGTFQDEAVTQALRLDSAPELVFLREKAEKARSTYLTLKSRYEDTSGDMYRNSWFKKTYLDPAWQENESKTQQFLDEKKKQENKTTNVHIAWLKVLYRLGLVFLCMLLVHRTMRLISQFK